MSVKNKTIVWFRQDLRIHDNPALLSAADAGDILPVYILDDVNAAEWAMGSASRVWLHESLKKLNESLNGKLLLLCGDAETLIADLVEASNATAVHWNRCYEPWRIQRDRKIKAALTEKGIKVESTNGSLLWEPWSITKKDGTPYKVYSPYFKRGCLGSVDIIRPVVRAPKEINYVRRNKDIQGLTLDELDLQPSIPWDKGILEAWDAGEDGAHNKLTELVARRLEGYKQGRDFPAMDSTSRLSPHLHFGEISPHQVWSQVRQVIPVQEEDLSHYLSELGWREFSYYLLFHWPTLPDQPFQPKYKAFPWGADKEGLKQWQQGKTGFPIIDAGMRELWQTGYMHNRVRMIVGSFLIKNQLIHWHEGARWFWDCLVDADLASNSASWQWVAGSGADASPYFRIFNPLLQSEKFDGDGDYLIRYVPELKGLPKKYRHKPWDAPANILQAAGIELGVDYPHPILDLKVTRERALGALKAMNNQLAMD
ncbi:MAG: deoxyribodipyrimidine photo-lyase [Pseudomonadales bacterium]